MNLCRDLDGRVRLLLLVGLSFIGRAQGAVVYDNTTTSLAQFYYSQNEYGDEINLAGADRTMTRFQFDIFAEALNPGAAVDVRFYQNDGSGLPAQPLTLLYDSGSLSITAAGQSPIVLNNLSVNVPSTITWTVQFSNVDPTHRIGLLFYNPPTVGSSFNDFWENVPASGWGAFGFGQGLVANFNAQATAVPEIPALWQSLLLVGAGLIAPWRFRRSDG